MPSVANPSTPPPMQGPTQDRLRGHGRQISRDPEGAGLGPPRVRRETKDEEGDGKERSAVQLKLETGLWWCGVWSIRMRNLGVTRIEDDNVDRRGQGATAVKRAMSATKCSQRRVDQHEDAQEHGSCYASAKAVTFREDDRKGLEEEVNAVQVGSLAYIPATSSVTHTSRKQRT